VTGDDSIWDCMTFESFKVTLDGRIQSIQEELKQFLNFNEVVRLESNEQQQLLVWRRESKVNDQWRIFFSRLD
jgi:hypothetical protein